MLIWLSGVRFPANPDATLRSIHTDLVQEALSLLFLSLLSSGAARTQRERSVLMVLIRRTILGSSRAPCYQRDLWGGPPKVEMTRSMLM